MDSAAEAGVTMARAQGQEGPVGDCTISLHNLLWVTVVWRKVECATLLKKCSSCSKTFGSQDDQCGKRTTMRARFEWVRSSRVGVMRSMCFLSRHVIKVTRHQPIAELAKKSSWRCTRPSENPKGTHLHGPSAFHMRSHAGTEQTTHPLHPMLTQQVKTALTRSNAAI